RVRGGPLGGALLAGRGIERLEHRVQEGALPVDVEAAAILPLVEMGLVLALGEVEMLVVALRLVRLDARSTDLVVEQAADEERVVADQFGRQAKATLPREEAVAGIAL